MYNFKYLVAGAALALATSAVAGGPEVPPAPVNNSGFYINANGGFALLSTSRPWNTTGWDAGLAVGYHWNNVRLELASNYIQNNATNTWRNAVIAADLGGGTFSFSNLDLWNLMVNGYYDFDFGSNFIPYVGIGLGWMNLQSTLTFNNNTVYNGVLNPARFSGNANAFAFQGILGLDYKVNDNVRIGVNYHALGWSNSNYYRNFVLVNNNAVTGVSFNNNSFENLINLSLSYFF